jgi:hypothetical protein
MARELVSDLFKRSSRHCKIAQTGETPGGRAKASVFAFKERLADERSQQSQDGPQSFDRQPNLVQVFFAARGRLFNTRDGALDQFIDDTSQARAHALVSTEDQLGRFHRHGVDKPPKRPKMRPFALGKCAVNTVGEDQKTWSSNLRSCMFRFQRPFWTGITFRTDSMEAHLIPSPAALVKSG